jgi:hypothetical protein
MNLTLGLQQNAELSADEGAVRRRFSELIVFAFNPFRSGHFIAFPIAPAFR